MISEILRNLIISQRKQGCSYNNISKNLDISKSTVQLVLTRKLSANKSKTGPKNKIDKKHQLSIKRYISKTNDVSERVTCSNVIRNCQINASKSTVRRQLSKMEFKYKKVPQTIALSKEHKRLRMEMVTNWITENLDFSNVVFSDEKRFSLDGPDNWMTYLPKNNQRCRVKRQSKGGGLMVWGMVFSTGTVFVKKLIGRQTSDTYKDLILYYAVPHILHELGTDFLFQQDNCSIHVSQKMKEFFEEQNLSILQWPSKSPDLNIMESIWKMLSDFVYNGPVFKNVEEIEQKIEQGLDHLNSNCSDEISKFFSGYRKRLCEVLKSNGNLTKY